MINPAGIPQIPGDMDVLAGHGETLKSEGANVSWTGLAVDSTWQGLSGFYQAPEAWELFAATGPVRTTSSDVGSDINAVGAAVVAYADELRPIQAQLRTLQTQATSFVSSVEDDEDWNKDGEKVEEHNQLLTQVDAAVAAYMAAQRTCANAINVLYGGIQYRVDDGQGEPDPDEFGYTAEMLDAAAGSEDGLPWGSAEERDKPWWEDTLDAVGSFFVGVWDGVWGTLVGLGNLVGLGGWEAFKTSWTSLGKLGLALVPGMVALNEMTALPGLEQGELGDTLIEVGQGLVAWDMWSEDPARAAGTTVFNVAAIFGTAGVATAATGVANVARVAGATRTAAVATRTAAIATGFPRVSTVFSGFRVADDAIRVSDDLIVPHVDVPNVDVPTSVVPHLDTPDIPAAVSRAPDAPPVVPRSPDTPPPAHGSPDTPPPHDGAGAPPPHGAPDSPPAREPIFEGQSPHHGADPWDPKVQDEAARVQQQLEPELQRAADEAWERASSDPDMAGASGQQLGTRAHQHFQDIVDESSASWFPEGGDYAIGTELSYRFDGVESRADLRAAERDGFNGVDPMVPAERSAPGSIRPDAVLLREGQPVVAFDLKTGSANIARWWEHTARHGLRLHDVVPIRPRG